MLKRFIRITLPVLISIILLPVGQSCNSDPDPELPDDEELFNDDNMETAVVTNVGEIVENISSPVEMAALIQDHGVPFSMKYLSPTDNIDGYTTNFEKALGLGILGADLGYLNIYSKTGSIISYISAIRDLTEDLQIGQFFDFQALKDLATNNENLDSLMYISVSSFNRMDAHLRKNNRSDISTLIVAGIWIEGLYLATQVVAEKPNQAIAERIGEQQTTLDELLILLKLYKADADFAALIKDFEEIRDAYEGVQITYDIGDPEAIEQDGMLIIVQKSTSNVNITDEQLERIIKIVEEKRNKIISL